MLSLSARSANPARSKRNRAGSRDPRSADRCPRHPASFRKLGCGPEILDSLGGIHFEKTAFQLIDQRIAQPDVVRVTADRAVAIAQLIE